MIQRYSHFSSESLQRAVAEVVVYKKGERKATMVSLVEATPEGNAGQPDRPTDPKGVLIPFVPQGS
jgi:hypothetical protein